jgi:hypothetical protein
MPHWCPPLDSSAARRTLGRLHAHVLTLRGDTIASRVMIKSLLTNYATRCKMVAIERLGRAETQKEQTTPVCAYVDLPSEVIALGIGANQGGFCLGEL